MRNKNTAGNATATGAITRSNVSNIPPVAQQPEKKSGGISPKRSPFFRRKKKSQHATFCTFIRRVLRQDNPNKAISPLSLQIINSMVFDLFDRIATEASKLTRISNRKTLTSRDLAGAAKLILRGGLSEHAVRIGADAVKKSLEN